MGSASSCCAPTRRRRRSSPSSRSTRAPLTAGFPSTTVTSLGSLGTGLPPGRCTGCSAIRSRCRARTGCSTACAGRRTSTRSTGSRGPTIYERAAAAEHRRLPRGARALREERPVQRALRGADYRPADSARRARRAGRRRARRVRPRPGYRLPRRPRRHRARVRVPVRAWAYQLAHVDKLAEQLARFLPDGTVLYVTADHGMVDVGPDDRSTRTPVPGAARRGGAARRRAAGPARVHRARRRGRRAGHLAERARRARLGGVPRRGRRGGWFGPVEPAAMPPGSGTWWRRCAAPGRSSRPRPSRWSPHSRACTAR